MTHDGWHDEARHMAPDGVRASGDACRPARRRLARALLALLPLAAACAGADVVNGVGGRGGTGEPLTGGSGAGTGTASALVGRWWRVVYLEDQWGGYSTSETTWDFSADSAATRVNTVYSATWGTSTTDVRNARWHTAGRDLVIRYTYPDTGTVRFTWSVERGVGTMFLRLDDTLFEKVPR